MEVLVNRAIPNPEFWMGRRVLVTGHTGFKGTWLCALLNELGAELYGMSLAGSATHPSMHDLIDHQVIPERDFRLDLVDHDATTAAIEAIQPETSLHLAAQSLVRESYRDPLRTLSSNVMGTASFLTALTRVEKPCQVVIVTTDKVYAPSGLRSASAEADRLGGMDIYSASKTCVEVVTNAYRTSFLNAGGIAVATARSGNVIGGGDWSSDRLIPDLIRSLASGNPLKVRLPSAVRPWQHVLEPLGGYLLLCEALSRRPDEVPNALNFGPSQDQLASVWDVVCMATERLTDAVEVRIEPASDYPETDFLSLDSSLARELLGWEPRWDLETSIQLTMNWYTQWQSNVDMTAITESQVRQFLKGL
jgi:CDP-glucose 4,6-dehydratase